MHALILNHQHLPGKGDSAPAGDEDKASFVAAKEEGEVIDPSGEEREGKKGSRLRGGKG